MCTIPPKRLFIILVYGVVFFIYIARGWGHELASLEGDEVIYLLSAEYFTFWTSHSSIAAYVAHGSPSPPLFPLFLSITGGAQSILAANILVALLMLSSFVAFFLWLLAEKLSEWRAFLLAFLFAVLPGAYIHALFVMSEGLFLLLSLGCLLATAKADDARDHRWLLTAALCAAAAALTRSAGWALIGAFGVYLYWHRYEKAWHLLALAAFPATTWSIFKILAGNANGLTYSGLFYEWYMNNPIWKGADPLSVFFFQIGTESQRFLKGLLADFTILPFGTGVSATVAAIFLIAAGCHAYRRRIDGIYVIFYTLMILVWPFSYAASAEKRFALVILPILLFQLWSFISSFSSFLFKRLRFNPVEVIFFCAIAVLALPALMLVAKSYFQPIPPELEPYRKVGWWYNWYWKDSVTPDYRYASYARMISQGLPLIGSRVPDGECLYSVKPYIVGFYTRKISKYPPKDSLSQADFYRELQLAGCRYFFFMNDVSPSYSEKRFYPQQRLGDSVEPVAILSYNANGVQQVLGILGRLK